MRAVAAIKAGGVSVLEVTMTVSRRHRCDCATGEKRLALKP